MRSPRALFAWILLGAAGLAFFLWAFPRAYPFLPREWRINRDEAIDIALERLRDLGEPVEDPYVVARLTPEALLERRLQLALGRSVSRAELEATRLPERTIGWEVTVFAPGASPNDWTYQALVSLAGEVLALRLQLDPQTRGAAVASEQARERADAFLVEQGVDLALYAEPQFRSRQLADRTDLAVRYPALRPSPAGSRYGLEVHFAGDRLAGFSPWFDDPGRRDLERLFQQGQLLGFGGLAVALLAAGLLAPPFLKRYHEGEIGVSRAAQIFVLVFAAGLLALALAMRASSQGSGVGFASRQQVSWILLVFGVLFVVLPNALLAFFSWSVGESICRERWGAKLAAFDALFQREWANATVARAALRGVVAGLALAGATLGLYLLLQGQGAWPSAAGLVASNTSSLPGPEIVLGFLGFSLPNFLAVALAVVPLAVRAAGPRAGALLALPLAAVLLFPGSAPLPLAWGALAALLLGGAVVLLFLRYDLLTVLVAGLVSQVLLLAYPLLLARDSNLELNGWIAVAVMLLPLLASVRSLAGGREFVYRYEDVPPHVRRIAERERQRVELETARRIQSSILPDLPPRLAGVDLAHAYLPASEVGGDFYDVLALEDGRLAVAVGDVAGHGVSSGLVMSMARSALAVQVTFNPDVEAVFATLNRMVFQTARKRLLATLCYALLDPLQKEILYASAGHLFPYVVSNGRGIWALESVAYPLGVRGELLVQPKKARLESGDILFLCSDGIVEARSERGELFGFERLEESLARHAAKSVEGLRDAVLADVARFTGPQPREDDQTVLVLRVP